MNAELARLALEYDQLFELLLLRGTLSPEESERFQHLEQVLGYYAWVG